MSLHPRQSIVEEVKATLIAAATALGDSVFAAQPFLITDEDPDLIIVYAEDEETPGEPHAAGSRQYERSLKLVTAGVVTVPTTDNPAVDAEARQAACNALAKQIETALHADPGRGGHAEETFLISSKLEPIPEGQLTRGIVEIEWQVRYLH